SWEKISRELEVREEAVCRSRRAHRQVRSRSSSTSWQTSSCRIRRARTRQVVRASPVASLSMSRLGCFHRMSRADPVGEISHELQTEQLFRCQCASRLPKLKKFLIFYRFPFSTVFTRNRQYEQVRLRCRIAS